MSRTIRVDSSSGVAAALESPTLVPPPPPQSLNPGATADLRAAMARFSHGDIHRNRRQAVVSLIEGFNLSQIEALASDVTGARLSGEEIEAVSALAAVVPTEVLAGSLGVPADQTKALIRDVERIVSVIGRGEPSSGASDTAAERIMTRFADHQAGPVPVVSLLYQNYDATAALTAVGIHAHYSRVSRHSAISSTIRFAIADTEIAGRSIPDGTTVELDLERTGFEFGSGAHRCPGEDLAQAIVRGIIKSLDDARYVLDQSGVETNSQGRPRTLPMLRPS